MTQSLLDDFIVDEIKGSLRRSKTIAEVNHTVAHFRSHIAEMRRHKAKSYFWTMAIQIENLRHYRCMSIRKGWG